MELSSTMLHVIFWIYVDNTIFRVIIRISYSLILGCFLFLRYFFTCSFSFSPTSLIKCYLIFKIFITIIVINIIIRLIIIRSSSNISSLGDSNIIIGCGSRSRHMSKVKLLGKGKISNWKNRKKCGY